MKKMPTFKRRDFIKTGGAITTGLLFFPACNSKIEGQSDFLFFTENEASCINVLCEQLIPADDQFGGANDAGVIYYIDKQLTGAFSEHAATYRTGIQKLQVHCEQEFSSQFQDLPAEQQIKVMNNMEGNKLAANLWKKPSAFFRLLRSHTMQGFYGSPIHGGNKDYMSFNMLQLGPPLNMR